MDNLSIHQSRCICDLSPIEEEQPSIIRLVDVSTEDTQSGDSESHNDPILHTPYGWPLHIKSHLISQSSTVKKKGGDPPSHIMAFSLWCVYKSMLDGKH